MTLCAKPQLCRSHSPCISPLCVKSSPRSAMRLKSLILIAFVSLTVLPAFGQSIDSDSGQVPMSTLQGPWRFHAGDDPSWSSPTFDDSVENHLLPMGNSS